MRTLSKIEIERLEKAYNVLSNSVTENNAQNIETKEEFVEYCAQSLPEFNYWYRTWLSLYVIELVRAGEVNPVFASEGLIGKSPSESMSPVFEALSNLHKYRDRVPFKDTCKLRGDVLDLVQKYREFDGSENEPRTLTTEEQLYGVIPDGYYDVCEESITDSGLESNVLHKNDFIEDLLSDRVRRQDAHWALSNLRFLYAAEQLEGKPLPGFTEHQFSEDEKEFCKSNRPLLRHFKSMLHNYPDYKEEYLSDTGVVRIDKRLHNQRKNILDTLLSGLKHVKQMEFCREFRGLNLLGVTPCNFNDRIQELDMQFAERQVGKPVPEKGVKIVEFDDGSAWFDLQTPGCQKEAMSMGHCGNMGQPRSSETVLSYRKPAEEPGMWRPSLTFILDRSSGWLGEMKGRKNNKPSEKYHAQIIELLKYDAIHEIVGGGYKAHNNFHINDLSKEHKSELLEARPDYFSAIKMIDYDMTGLPQFKQLFEGLSLFEMVTAGKRLESRAKELGCDAVDLFDYKNNSVFIGYRDKLDLQGCFDHDLTDHPRYKQLLDEKLKEIEYKDVDGEKLFHLGDYDNLEELARNFDLDSYEEEIRVCTEGTFLDDFVECEIEDYELGVIKDAFEDDKLSEERDELCQVCSAFTDEHSLEEIRDDLDLMFAIVTENEVVKDLLREIWRDASIMVHSSDRHKKVVEHASEIANGVLKLKFEGDSVSLYEPVKAYIPKDKLLKAILENGAATTHDALLLDEDVEDSIKEQINQQFLFDFHDYSPPYYGYDTCVWKEHFIGSAKERWTELVSEQGLDGYVNGGSTASLEMSA